MVSAWLPLITLGLLGQISEFKHVRSSLSYGLRKCSCVTYVFV